VQSEKVRGTYIRVFKEAYGSKFGKPKDKFIALGSPKFDKVINTKRESCDLPEKWRELISDKNVGQGLCSCRKKSILYNTSVNVLLICRLSKIKK